jgi:hypothetical protein
MPTRAACAGSEVPAPSPPSAQGTTRPRSPATSSRPIVLRTHWTPSPCRRLSRPPWWRVTATTTTGPPPRPGGNSGRCACPEPEGSAGTAGTLPTFTHQPVGRVGAQLYPGGIAMPHRNTRHDPTRPKVGRPGRSPATTRTEHLGSPQPPVSGLLRDIGASNTGSSPTPSCLATAHGLLAADRCSIVRGCSRPPPHLRHQTAPQLHRPLRRPAAGPFIPPGHMALRGALLLCATDESQVRLRFFSCGGIVLVGASD